MKKDEFIPNLKKIIDFYDKLDNYYKKVKENNQPKKEAGYLMSKKIFDDFKEKLCYSELKNHSSNLLSYKRQKEIFKDKEELEYEGGEQRIFNNYKELEEDLNKGNEYVIVNKTIWKSINNGNKSEFEGVMKYEINSKNLILFLNDNNKDNAFFKHDSNIINKKNLLITENEIEDDLNDTNENPENNKKLLIKNYNIYSKPKPLKNEDKSKENINKREMVLLIELYFFYQELQKKFDESNTTKTNSSNVTECYLIKEDWFIKHNYLEIYNKIEQNITNNIEYKDKNKELVIEDLSKKNEFKFLNNQNEVTKINDLAHFKIEYKLNYDNTEMIFLYKYIIINKNVFNYIITHDFEAKTIKALQLCINNKKIIILNEEKKALFIGKIDSVFNKFIPKIILEYNEKEQLEKQFDDIKKNNFPEVEKYLNFIKDIKIGDLTDENENNKIIGKYYIIDKMKYTKLNKYIENIFTNLDKNYEEIKLMKEKKYYLINKRYIKKLKELFKYTEYLKIIEDNNKDINNQDQSINKILNENKSIFCLDVNKIKKELDNKDYLKLKTENLNESQMFSFLEFEIITEKLKECLMDYDLFPKELEIIEIKCLLIDNSIIFFPNLQGKYLAFNCAIKDNNEYLIEVIYDFKDNTTLEKYNDIQTFKKLSFKTEQILDEEEKLCGKYYDLLKKDENEIKEDKNAKSEKEITENENINNNEDLKEKDKNEVTEHINKNDNKEINKPIKNKGDILNIIKIHLFNKDLSVKILQSNNKIDDNKEKNKQNDNIFVDKCILINRENIELYKKYYLYNELEKHINDTKIEKYSTGNFYSNKNLEIIYESLKKSELFDEYKSKGLFQIDEKMFDIIKSKISKEIDINYYDDFTIIDEDIFKEILSDLKIKNDIKEYIINSGKIIIFFDEKEEKNFQVLIGEFNSNSLDLEILINFKDELKFNEFKKNSSGKSYNILIEELIEQNKNNEIGSIFGLKNYYFEKVRFLAAIHLNIEKIKYLTKDSGFNEVQGYYLANKEWIQYLNKFYDFDKIIEKLKENDTFNKYEKAFLTSGIKNIKQNTEEQNKAKKGKKVILKDLLKNIVDNEKFGKINNEELSPKPEGLEINSEMQKLTTDKNEISFYNNFFIVNNQIIKFLKIIFKIDSEEKSFIPINCLKYNESNYIFYSLNEHHLINIGNFNNELIFDTNIVVDIKTKDIHTNILKDENIIKDVQSYSDILISDKSKESIIINNSNNEEIGTAFKIIKTNENKLKENEDKDNSLGNMDDNNIQKNNFIKESAPNNKKEFITNNCKKLYNLKDIKKDEKKKIKLKLFTNDMNFIEEKVKDKMVKLFILLFIHYKEIEKNIREEINKNGKKQYYLIKLISY